MPLDPLFALRGLLSFTAFTDLVTSSRCLLPDLLLPGGDDDYVRTKLFSLAALWLWIRFPRSPRYSTTTRTRLASSVTSTDCSVCCRPRSSSTWPCSRTTSRWSL